MPRCWRTASYACGRCATPGPPTAIPYAAAARETWEPRFTFHGFRYAEVQGWPGELQPGDLRAVVCHSDLRRTGWFECSDALINQLHDNIVWGMRGNFLDVPTDCPQRDERLGWTGDIQVFAPTASFLFDCAGFLQSWLADLAVEQKAKGVVPFFVPELTLDRPNRACRGMGRRRGDRAVGAVPAVRRYGYPGAAVRQHARVGRPAGRGRGPSRLWDRGFQFGDWLDPSRRRIVRPTSKTDPAVCRHSLLRSFGRLLAPCRRGARPRRRRSTPT